MNKYSYNKLWLNRGNFSGTAGYSQKLSSTARFSVITTLFTSLKTADLKIKNPLEKEHLPATCLPPSGCINSLDHQLTNICLRN